MWKLHERVSFLSLHERPQFWTKVQEGETQSFVCSLWKSTWFCVSHFFLLWNESRTNFLSYLIAPHKVITRLLRELNKKPIFKVLISCLWERCVVFYFHEKAVCFIHILRSPSSVCLSRSLFLLPYSLEVIKDRDWTCLCVQHSTLAQFGELINL